MRNEPSGLVTVLMASMTRLDRNHRRHVHAFAADRDSAGDAAELREVRVGIENRDAGDVVGRDRVHQRGCPRGRLRHACRGEGVLQADRMADFVNRGHQEALVIAGPGRQREVHAEMHDRAHDGVELRAVRRGDRSGQRGGAAKAFYTRREIFESHVATGGVLRRSAVFEASEHDPEIGGRDTVPDRRRLLRSG